MLNIQKMLCQKKKKVKLSPSVDLSFKSGNT